MKGVMKLNVLVACEESQRVTIELRKLGHNAFSCDVEPCSGGHPEWHIQSDVLPLINGCCSFYTVDNTKHDIDSKWDVLIAFPPCTYLTSAGTRHYSLKCNPPEKVKARERGKKQFNFLWNLSMLIVIKLRWKIQLVT